MNICCGTYSISQEAVIQEAQNGGGNFINPPEELGTLSSIGDGSLPNAGGNMGVDGPGWVGFCHEEV
jgi:hypothetical protein